jgi:hypothetical protein
MTNSIKNMNRGGYRTGAGRKKGFAALQAEQSRELFAQTLAPRLEKIILALMKRAQTGDVHAAHELFDRAWGKPQQKLEANIDIQKRASLNDIQNSMREILDKQ